jgi:RNA polymerase sigma-70 factor, ECF subfamily
MTVDQAGSKTLSIYGNLSPEEKVELLFRQYYAGLCKSLYRTLRDASLAEDIVQEVFLKVWDRRATLQLDEAVAAYLYRSCYNTALNFLQRQKPQTDIDPLAESIPGSDSADKDLGLLETESQVRQAIAALPPQTRLVFSLSRFGSTFPSNQWKNTWASPCSGCAKACGNTWWACCCCCSPNYFNFFSAQGRVRVHPGVL